jgi:pimeloyl-ACP methyl ester carboxylesterase
VRTVVSPAGLRGTAVEIVWVAAHLAHYPFGFAKDRSRAVPDRYNLTDLPPVQRGLLIADVEAAGTPILLVHGIVDNRSIFTLLRRGLRRRGFGRVFTMNYQVVTQDVKAAARQLAACVDQVCEQTGYERIHVIGHSLGGVIARYYVQRMGGDERVHTLVTLGSPHQGTRAAHLVPHPVPRQLRPDSALMAELGEPAPGCRTRFVCFWGDLDALMIPKRAATIEHPDLAVRNVFIRGVGHMSLPIHHRVVHEISTTLAYLDSDGTTVTAGVTPIASESGAPPPTPSKPRRISRSARPTSA